MTLKYTCVVVACLFCLAGFAQKSGPFGSKGAHQTLFVEAGGPGILSINYDQRFQGEQGLGIRAGVGGYGFLKKGVFTIPLGLNYLTGSGDHFAELGAGVTIASSSVGNTYFDNPGTTTAGFINFGYRYVPQKKNLSFRAFISPLFTAAGTIPFYGGGSVGIKF
ncbi:MAG TPA: hypothetical protein VGE25_07660 [Sediminibacterium sp.]